MKRMGFYKVVLAASALLLLMTGCNNLMNTESGESEYGRLVISSDDRALNLGDLKFTKVSVTGTGISIPLESEYVALTNGGGYLEVKNIPVGVNRIVTAYAYDSEKAKIGSVMVRAVKTIVAGTNTVQVNKTTTALGNVLYNLETSGYDVSIISETQLAGIQSSIDSTKSWTLIDTDAIAKDFKTSSLKSSSNYVLSAASAKYTNNLENLSIQICDPLSAVVESAASGSATISNVAPGTWPVYILQNGSILKKTFCTFIAGQTTDLGNFGSAVKDKIIVHVETSSGYKNIYAWVNETTKVFGAWPGAAMTDSDGDGWYDVEIPQTSVQLIFNGNGQTSDLSREAGEWWYKAGTWYDANPNDSIAPALVSFSSNKTGTVSGTIILTVVATDNKGLKSAVISDGSKTLKTVSLSGTSASESFEWDTNDVENGTVTLNCTVYDASDNVAPSIGTVTLTISNANLPPVAVISGSTRVDPSATTEFSGESSYDKHGTISAYQWTVSGAVIKSGATSAKCSVQAPSTEDSEFTISLKVKDAEGLWSEVVSKKVSVKTKVSNDFREESIYFLMTARFYDGDSENNRWCRADDASGNRANNDYPWRGDFKGLIEKLDYIKAMGFSAVWITPPVLNRSDFDFHGYHAWNMNKIDPRLESAGASYQDLIDACHAKGIKVIQDIVLNHSSRYGLEDLFVPKYWGDRDDPDWGVSNEINYYDEYNPSFTYNGLDVEPKSGKTWYNGDLWQKEKPVLSWNPDLSTWGVMLGVNKDGRKYYGCQWPTTELFNPEYFHTGWLKNWEDETCQSGTIHEDCMDLNTESKAVQDYLINAYTKYIDMGVDAFRIDTVKHLSRVMFNRHFIPAFKKAGGDNFYMFGEVCTRVNEVWNHGVPPLSTPFYTWKERQTYSADDSVAVHEGYEYEKNMGPGNQPTSDNHSLAGTNGNDYHTPDYSQSSGLNVIDFPMHWNFSNAGQAYNMRQSDYNYNDATWNVVYVDSHDYGPNMDNRYAGGTSAWAENMTYMWTFRGIPCIYYGSEIEFKAGADADKGPSAPLENTGRAYYGDNITGSVTATDFSEYTGATGAVATTLGKPLPQHLRDLNKIRRAIPALQKGQYSNTNCDGSMAFKRRFVDANVDSFVLVTISGNATFSGLPAGTYIDVVTGDKKVVAEGGSITTSGCSGSGNARIYVNTSLKGCEVTGKIAQYSSFLK